MNRRLAAVFGTGILLPAVLVVTAVWWLGRADHQTARVEIRERTGLAADRLAAAVDGLATRWKGALAALAAGTSPQPGTLPSLMADAVSEPAAGVVISLNKGSVVLYPPRALAWDISPTPREVLEPRTRTAAIVAAEKAELAEKDFAAAAVAYNAIAREADGELRALALHRLARVLRRQGRFEAAIETYRRLAEAPSVEVDGLPSGFVGRYQLCQSLASKGPEGPLPQAAFALYRDVTEGTWVLSPASYAYHVFQLKCWVEAGRRSAPGLAELQMLEARKIALTQIASRLLARVKELPASGIQVVRESDHGHLVLFAVPSGVPPGERAAGLIVSEDAMRRRVWPAAMAEALGPGFAVEWSDTGGTVVFGDHPPPAADGIPMASRALSYFDRPATLRVWPQDVEQLQPAYSARRWLRIGVGGIVVFTMLLSGALAIRALRHELDLARLKGELASAVSHEFRTPLTGIHQLVELLRNGAVESEPRRQEYYDLIMGRTARLGRLVENVLDFSRMEDGRRRYHFEPLSTSDWLSSVVSDFTREIGGRGVEIVTTIPQRLPPLLADEQALGMAIHNVLDNAVNYSPGQPAVWIEAEESGHWVVIRIRDRGIGIAPPDTPRVFDRFFRGDHAVVRGTRGTGLGLSLVKTIVTAHDGSVEFTSRVNEGTTFVLRLPTVPGTNAVAEG